MNSSSHAGSTISCPWSPPLQRLLPSLHSTPFILPIFTPQKQSTLQKKGRLKEKQTAADEITQHLVLLDICKTPSERRDAHPRECMRARVIRTRAGMCFVFVLLYGGGIKDKCINEHLERNSLCLLVSVTASRAQTLSLTRMMWLMEGELSVRSGALPGAAVCLGWQRRSPKGPPSHTSAGKVREDAVLPPLLLIPHSTDASCSRMLSWCFCCLWWWWRTLKH